jgi:hypothetical protein
MRLKEVYQKNKHILQLYFIFILIFISSWFLVAFLLQIEGFSTTLESINKEVSSTFINGILTVTAIIFGFISIEIRRFFKTLSSILLIIFPIFIALFGMVYLYFRSIILLGYPTVGTAFWVFVFFISVTTYGIALLLSVARYQKKEIDSLTKD